MIDVSSSEFRIFAPVFVFLAGLCFGSFLKRLKAKDLIPVFSYIFLKGKCRYCNEPVSIQYPVVEMITSVIWLIIYLRYGFTIEAAGLILLFTILIPVFFIDLQHMIIPNGLVLSGLIGGAAVFLYHVFVKPFGLYESALWYTPLIGMFSSSLILFAVALIGLAIYKNDGAMGMGDVKIFMPIGLFLGWKLSLLTLVISVLLGGIILLLFKIKDRKSAIPFGPFIITAALFSALYGNQFLRWYLSICY